MEAPFVSTNLLVSNRPSPSIVVGFKKLTNPKPFVVEFAIIVPPESVKLLLLTSNTFLPAPVASSLPPLIENSPTALLAPPTKTAYFPLALAIILPPRIFNLPLTNIAALVSLKLPLAEALIVPFIMVKLPLTPTLIPLAFIKERLSTFKLPLPSIVILPE